MRMKNKVMKKWNWSILTFGVLCWLWVFCSSDTIFAKTPDTQFQNDVMNAYADAMLEGEMRGFESLMSETSENELFFKYLQWRYAAMEILEDGYDAYSYEITDVTNVSDTEIKIEFNEYFHYANIDFQGFSMGLVLDIKVDEGCIQSISVQNDDCFDAFMNNLSFKGRSAGIEKEEDQIDLQMLIEDIRILKSEMDSVCSSQTARLEQDETENWARATAYSYSASRGAEYAKKYAKDANSSFYAASADCTNFVSQCIWAAYGGWNSSMSTTKMTSNISNKVRMVSGSWYAGSGGGSSNWESVNNLWSYATSNSGNGPKAKGYNNGGKYTGIQPIDISVGDVLQVSGNGKSYTHSVYVIGTPGGSNPSYGEIVVAQHSSNKTRTLSNLLLSYNYMRQMRFQSGKFAS